MTLLEKVLSFGGAFGTIVITILIFLFARMLLNRQSRGNSDWGLIRSIILFAIVSIGFIAIILALPFTESTRGQLTSLIGIVVSAIFALSSATFIGNALAGIMLRLINNFRPGDFIKVGDHFGRISERGLFHTEIQTENRDLTTLPNMFLATNPVRVTRSSGTFISAVCSLGYDVNHKVVAKVLTEAATSAGLTDPFMEVTELGDFSIVYTIYGLLKDPKTLITSRSKLRACMLDALHEAKIEIVSPTFMNQRQVNETVFIPKKPRKSAELEQKEGAVEAKIFDKADDAESVEKRKMKISECDDKLKELNANLKVAETEEDKASCQKKIDQLTEMKNKLEDRLQQKLEDLDKA